MSKTKNKLKGSGILIVVLASITFSIYASSTYAEQQHFSIMENKYEKNIVDYYEKDMNNIDQVYNDLVQINAINTNVKIY